MSETNTLQVVESEYGLTDKELLDKKKELLKDIDDKIETNSVASDMHLSGKKAHLSVEFQRNIIALLTLKLKVLETMGKKRVIADNLALQKTDILMVGDEVVTKITDKIGKLLYKG